MDAPAQTDTPSPAEAATATDDALPAAATKGIGPRALAVLVDGFLLGVVDLASVLVASVTVLLAVSALRRLAGSGLPFFRGEGFAWQGSIAVEHGNPWPTAIALAATMPVVYFFLFEWLYGATPGKLLLNMRVVTTDGRPCGLKAAAVRGVLRYVDVMVLGLVAILLMRRPPHRRLGDRAAGTMVVDRESPGLAQPRPRRRFWTAGVLYFALACAVNGTLFAGALVVTGP
jgi:uncharacterized RDD family membrane protein YckC